jgi:hypothetical protein
MEGLRSVMPKGQREPRPAAVTVRVGTPVHLPQGTPLSEAVPMLENALRQLAGQAPHHYAPAMPPLAEPDVAAATAAGGR